MVSQERYLDIMERNEAYLLEKTEEDWEETFNAISDLLFVIDNNFRLIKVNKAACNVLQKKPEELIGRHCFEVVHNTDRSWPNCPYRKTLKTREITTEVIDDQHLGLPLLVTTSPILDSEGKVKACVHIAKDITESKKRQEELESSEHYLDEISDILIVITPETNIVKVNKSFTNLWGYTPEQVYGKSVLKMFTKEETKNQLNEMKIAMKTGTTRKFETVGLTKNGKKIPLQMSGRVMKDDNGKLKGFIAIIKDNTEFKKEEEKRSKLIHKYSERIKELNCLYGISKIVEKYKKLNKIVIESLNLLPSAWQYPSITCARIIIDDQDYKTSNFKETKWRQQSDIVILERNIGTIEVYYLEEKPTMAEGPFLKEERKLIDAIAERLARIIERMRTEEKLEDLLGQLKLSNEKLKQSNIDLENYSYVISHDLRAPLRSIRSFSSFLLEDYANRLDDVGLDYLNRIDNAGDHMDSLIKDLLLLSRVGRKFIDIIEVDLNELLDEIASDIEVIIEDNNARIEYDKLPSILVPKIWMKELFLNLISNGIKFNQSENPIVEVKCEDREEDWLFIVHDNGIGIEEKYHDQIFALFERLHSKEEYPGTGAGLAICKRIIENFGGKIWVKSQLGDGSTFYFSIPKKMELKK